MVAAFYFFFSSRRRHTRLQGDWSSDVCSSDLVVTIERTGETGPERAKHGLLRALVANAVQGVSAGFTKQLDKIGRASCRERVERSGGGGAAERKDRG